MPVRWAPYVVRQGDYLSQLACRRGFDAMEVWQDPRNAELRGRRGNPEVLLPGDVLFLPDQPPTALPFAPGITNRFRAAVPKVEVAIVLRNHGEPLALERFRIDGAGAPIEGRTDAEGTVRAQIPALVRELDLTFPDRHLRFSVGVGHLDPITAPSGVRQRLEHLGYYAHGPRARRGRGVLAAGADRRAVAAFQAASGLPATGDPDDATRAALLRAHGS